MLKNEWSGVSSFRIPSIHCLKTKQKKKRPGSLSLGRGFWDWIDGLLFFRVKDFDVFYSMNMKKRNHTMYDTIFDQFSTKLPSGRGDLPKVLLWMIIKNGIKFPPADWSSQGLGSAKMRFFFYRFCCPQVLVVPSRPQYLSPHVCSQQLWNQRKKLNCWPCEVSWMRWNSSNSHMVFKFFHSGNSVNDLDGSKLSSCQHMASTQPPSSSFG